MEQNSSYDIMGSIEKILNQKPNETDSNTISGVSKKRRFMEIKKDNGNIKIVDLKPLSVNRTNPGCQISIMDISDSEY
jgi:hypothetical protein